MQKLRGVMGFKNAPRKSEELVISNLEDYCSGDRGEILTVLEIMNLTEPVYRGSVIDTEQAEVSSATRVFSLSHIYNFPHFKTIFINSH